MHCAVNEGHFDVIKFLISYSDSQNLPNDSGYTPRDIAIQKNQQNIVTLFNSNGIGTNQGLKDFEEALAYCKICGERGIKPEDFKKHYIKHYKRQFLSLRDGMGNGIMPKVVNFPAKCQFPTCSYLCENDDDYW